MRLSTIKRILRDVVEDNEAELIRDYYGTIEHVLDEMALSIQKNVQLGGSNDHHRFRLQNGHR